MARRPTTIDTSKISFETPTSKGEVGRAKSTVPGEVADRHATLSSVRPVQNGLISRYLNRISNSGLRDTVVPDVDVEDYVEPRPTVENLPAVISTALAKSGVIKPKWHMVKHLPGYISSAIRAMGRQVFYPVTSTPIEQIYVVSTLSNPEVEVNYVGNWIKQNGVRNDQMKYKFEQLLPGYEADVHVWNVKGYTFVVVKDFAGKYIYGWPESDNKVGKNVITHNR